MAECYIWRFPKIRGYLKMDGVVENMINIDGTPILRNLHNLEIHVLHDYSHSANLQLEGDA